MSHMVLLYGSVIGLALFLFLAVTHGDEARPTRLARVRVWIDDQERRRHGGMAPDEEAEQSMPGPWLFLLAALVLLILLLNTV